MTLFCALILILVPAQELAKEDPMAQARADRATFVAFLMENKLDGTWQRGDPFRRDTDAVRRAYAGYRAYFTFSQKPLGGRPRAYQDALAEYQKNSLSIAVLIKDGKVTVLKKPEDFNTGLRPIKTEEDARIAAAAIVSLLPAGELGPNVMDANNVKATQEKGWVCTCRVGRGAVSGEATVTFDDNGRCTSIIMPGVMLPRIP
jgi:hypothetical protein